MSDLLKGVRYQKRINLGKFLRLNISKTGIGLSIGLRGLRYTLGPSGSRLTVGLPGTGLTYQTKVGNSKGLRFASLKKLLPGQGDDDQMAIQTVETDEAEALPLPEKPGLFAPGWEKDLHKAIVAYDEGRYDAMINHLADGIADAKADMALAVLLGHILARRDQPGDRTEAIRLLEMVVASEQPFPSPIMERYLTHLPVEIGITPQVAVTLPIIDGLATTLLLVELFQAEGEVEEAIDLLEEVDQVIAEANAEDHDRLITLSLFELYFLSKNYKAITEQVHLPEVIDDDIILAVAFFYGRALQEQNLHEAAIQVFNNCLKRRKGLNPVIQQACRLWRAMSLIKTNQKARAKKELERTLAEAPNQDIRRACQQTLHTFWPDEYRTLA